MTQTEIAAEPEAPNLAVDILPDTGPGTFVLDVSELDGPDMLSWAVDGWTNIICDVISIRGQRGATRLQGALTRTEAGTATVTLLDVGRRFDPTANADAVHPGIPIRVRAWAGTDPAAPEWSEVLFTGRLGGDLDVRYSQTEPPTVSFTAVDVVGPLARYGALGRADPGAGDGDTLLARVQRVVAEAGLPATTVSTDSDTGYVATLAPTSLTDGWGDINAAQEAELGRVWVTREDQLAVRARGSELVGPVRGTLSDWHGETVSDGPHCCYTDPLVRYGTDGLVNRAIGARRVPRPEDGSSAPPSALVQVDQTASQARWGGVSSHEDRGLELRTDDQLQAWGEWLVLQAAEPELRVDSVTVAPRDSPEAWRAVCQTDIGDRWHFRLHPEVGAPVERTLGVLGIVHEITPEAWTTTWTMTDAPTPGAVNPSGWFVLDVSELGGDDVLAPLGGAA